jgi:hypothetical protein
MWLYPPFDPEIMPRWRFDEICAGGEEDLVYKRSFDAKAERFDLEPGDALSWPAFAPHRVLNGDELNVSLSTFHNTEAAMREVQHGAANYFFSRRLPGIRLPADYRSPLARVEDVAYRACRRFGLAKPRPAPDFLARHRIDASAPTGLVCS